MGDQAQSADEFRPTLSMAKDLTKAELHGCKRLRDRIKLDLYAAPNTPETQYWRAQQVIALAVIEERIAYGR